MYAVVLFLIVITSTSSSLYVSSNNNNGDPEIYMVVDDQSMTMHDSGVAISKANPIQIGKFHLKDGKVLTLSRRSSPSRNCVGPDQPCGALDWCCEGLYCDGFFDGRCHPVDTFLFVRVWLACVCWNMVVDSTSTLREISYTPKESPAHPKHGRLQFHCGTPKYPHSETKKDHSPPSTRHSPRSTLEVLPSVYYPELNFSTRHCNILQGPNRFPVTAEGARTYSLPTTPSRETYMP
nr:mitogen-activated protein kinase kinase kinase 5-like isoform X1 [Tanacetum cinerariifolium]